MELYEIQKLVFETYRKSGHLEMWNRTFSNEYTQEQRIYDIAELSLVVTEISELIEGIREGKDFLDDELCFELADIIIRVLNFSSRKSTNIEHYISRKNRINLKREYLHGKVV